MSVKENTLFNLAMEFCQSGDPLNKPIILKVINMPHEQQADFLGYVAAWCAGAHASIEEFKKAK